MSLYRLGFTLPELLITVAIIVIIASIGAIHYVNASHRAKRAAAASLIAEMELAISGYRIDMRCYPPDSKGSASLRAALDPHQTDAIWSDPSWGGPYMEFQENEVDQITGHILDPWHESSSDPVHRFSYRADRDGDPRTGPPFHNRSTYDIYSPGRDGRSGHSSVLGDEMDDGAYAQNGIDDDGDGVVDELDPSSEGAANGFLEDDINNW